MFIGSIIEFEITMNLVKKNEASSVSHDLHRYDIDEFLKMNQNIDLV